MPFGVHHPYIYSYQVLSIYIVKSIIPSFNEIRQIHIYTLPRYGSGHKSAYSKKHFFKIQRAITPLLTYGVQCHLACIIFLSIYVLIPSFNEIRRSTSKILLRTQKYRTDGRTDGQPDNAKTISLRLWRGITTYMPYGTRAPQREHFTLKENYII